MMLNLVARWMGKLGRTCAFENFVHESGGAILHVGKVDAIGEESPCPPKFSEIRMTVDASLRPAPQAQRRSQ